MELKVYFLPEKIRNENIENVTSRRPTSPPQSNPASPSGDSQGPRRPSMQESRSLSKSFPNNQMHIAVKSSVKPQTVYMNNGNKDNKRNFGPTIQIIPGPMHTSLRHTGLDNKMRIAANQNVASQVKKTSRG